MLLMKKGFDFWNPGYPMKYRIVELSELGEEL
jgi:hypothetical protein